MTGKADALEKERDFHRLLEAADRGLWERPAPDTLDALRDVRLKAETFVEARGERVQTRS